MIYNILDIIYFVSKASYKILGGNIVKMIKFNGDKILTIRESGKIYVSVKNVCNNLGMNKNQKDTQVKKVSNDATLKGALKLTHLETNGGMQQVLMLELDYLPLWLAKINPARFNEELKNKLLDYQLHCKDILADEFFGSREIILPDKNDQRFNPDLNDIEDRIPLIRELENKLFQIYGKLKYHYHWIFSRSSSQEDKIIKYMKELREKFFIHDGKEMTTLDIDKLNNK